MTGEGKVWLAGAGPGDAGLLTLKARQLMDTVDVIVYDALVSMEILSMIPQEKELIYVGKRKGHHHVPQEEINEILLREAKRGKRVLRLKGGDPFVFGRGGEELEPLKASGIPFEIVPGVTSAAAVPAYAGIPVTHRNFTSSFHVITGHPRKDGTSRVDYPSLVKLKGTLVFLMGITSMEEIMRGLIGAGLDRNTPAAVIERGTLARQRRVVSTAENLYEEARKADIGTPAVILVGEVCALSQDFHWAEDRPLGGKQILVTRPGARASKLTGRLRELGAQVIELPAIRTRTLSPNPCFKKAMEQFGAQEGEEWLVFTSPAGVDAFFELLHENNLDLRSILTGPAKVKIAAIGSATAGALGNYGLLADLVPKVYCAEALGKELAECAGAGSRITVVRAKDGSGDLLPPLWKAGLETMDIPLYETVCEVQERFRERVGEMIQSDEIDAVTFTSASTVRGFMKAFEPETSWKVKAYCIGEQTAGEAQRYGMDTETAPEASIDSMVSMLIEHLAK